MNNHSNLLFLTDFYPPGFRSGGPSRSCYNLSVGLGKRVAVKVLTRDRDLGSPLPYPQVIKDQWILFAPGVEVCYLTETRQNFRQVVQRIRQSAASTLYLNSMFSVPFTIYPLLAHWLGLIQGRVVLAPRGMLKPSALQFKARKKDIFLRLFKILRWHQFIVFQASSPEEAADIRTQFGANTQVVICAPVPDLALLQQRSRHTRSMDAVRFCLIGRIHPIKNVHRAMELLAGISQPVTVDVIGPFEDAAYYTLCQSITAALPAHIEVHFHGALPTLETQAILQQADFFYLLTQGENFGHAIFEALALGKPVLISDQTPWRQLEVRLAGWDVDVNQPEQVVAALQTAVLMSDAEYQQWSEGAYQLAERFVEQSDWEREYLELFGLEAEPVG